MIIRGKEMSKKLLAVLILCSLSVFGQALASDDVYVDLSVLDNMPSDSIGFVQSEPLFPIYKPSKPVVKPAKKVRVRSQSAVKKAPVVTVKTEELSPVETTAHDAETSMTETQEPLIDTEVSTTPETADKTAIATPLPEEMQPGESTTPETVKHEETVISKISGEMTQMQTPVPHADEEKQEVTGYLPVVDAVYGVAGLEENPSQEPAKAEEPQEVSQPEPQATMSASSVNMSESEETSHISSPKEIYSLTFADDSSDILDENIQKLDKMVSTFDADRKKKIIIKAYNYDNGDDSFKRKRISLNRAIAIRSYFLNQGFTNFGIKIVNTNSENEYKNTVEVEEMK